MLNASEGVLTQRGSQNVTERVVKQIGLPEDLQRKLKIHAIEQDKELQEIQDEAMKEFFADRDKVRKEKARPPDYFQSPKKAPPVNIRLSKTIASKVEKAAKEDEASDRRLIYNGILNYARKRRIIE